MQLSVDNSEKKSKTLGNFLSVNNLKQFRYLAKSSGSSVLS